MRTTIVILVAAVAAAVALAAGGAGATTPSYAVEALGTDVVPYAVGARGDVVGLTLTAHGSRGYVRRPDGTVVDPGTLPKGSNAFVTGVDATGRIAGSSDTVVGGWPGCSATCAPATTWRAFRGDGASLADLGGDPLAASPESTRAPASWGLAMSDRGDVAGAAITGSGDVVAGYWAGGTFHRDVAGDNGFATGINASDDVVGLLVYRQEGFARIGGRLIPLPNAVGTLKTSVENDGWPSINDAGHVAYTAAVSGTSAHAVLLQGGSVTDLGTLGGASSTAFGIGPHDEVVGASRTRDGATHAFLYRDGRMVDLNDLVPSGTGWVLESARGVNAAGEVVGVGNRGAFLLTPAQAAPGSSPPVATVPRTAPSLPPAPAPTTAAGAARARLIVAPRPARVGELLAVTLVVTPGDGRGTARARVDAVATLRGRRVPLLAKGWSSRGARAVWRLPRRVSGATVRVTVSVTAHGVLVRRAAGVTVR